MPTIENILQRALYKKNDALYAMLCGDMGAVREDKYGDYLVVSPGAQKSLVYILAMPSGETMSTGGYDICLDTVNHTATILPICKTKAIIAVLKKHGYETITTADIINPKAARNYTHYYTVPFRYTGLDDSRLFAGGEVAMPVARISEGGMSDERLEELLDDLRQQNVAPFGLDLSLF